MGAGWVARGRVGWRHASALACARPGDQLAQQQPSSARPGLARPGNAQRRQCASRAPRTAATTRAAKHAQAPHQAPKTASVRAAPVVPRGHNGGVVIRVEGGAAKVDHPDRAAGRQALAHPARGEGEHGRARRGARLSARGAWGAEGAVRPPLPCWLLNGWRRAATNRDSCRRTKARVRRSGAPAARFSRGAREQGDKGAQGSKAAREQGASLGAERRVLGHLVVQRQDVLCGGSG